MGVGYRTAPFNLTSNMVLEVQPGASIVGCNYTSIHRPPLPSMGGSVVAGGGIGAGRACRYATGNVWWCTLVASSCVQDALIKTARRIGCTALGATPSAQLTHTHAHARTHTHTLSLSLPARLEIFGIDISPQCNKRDAYRWRHRRRTRAALVELRHARAVRQAHADGV